MARGQTQRPAARAPLDAHLVAVVDFGICDPDSEHFWDRVGTLVGT